MNVVLALSCLVGVLALLSLREAHHLGHSTEGDRALVVVATAQGLVVLVLAVAQVLVLTRP